MLTLTEKDLDLSAVVRGLGNGPAIPGLDAETRARIDHLSLIHDRLSASLAQGAVAAMIPVVAQFIWNSKLTFTPASLDCVRGTFTGRNGPEAPIAHCCQDSRRCPRCAYEDAKEKFAQIEPLLSGNHAYFLTLSLNGAWAPECLTYGFDDIFAVFDANKATLDCMARWKRDGRLIIDGTLCRHEYGFPAHPSRYSLQLLPHTHALILCPSPLDDLGDLKDDIAKVCLRNHRQVIKGLIKAYKRARQRDGGRRARTGHLPSLEAAEPPVLRFTPTPEAINIDIRPVESGSVFTVVKYMLKPVCVLGKGYEELMARIELADCEESSRRPLRQEVNESARQLLEAVNYYGRYDLTQSDRRMVGTTGVVYNSRPPEWERASASSIRRTRHEAPSLAAESGDDEIPY